MSKCPNCETNVEFESDAPFLQDSVLCDDCQKKEGF